MFEVAGAKRIVSVDLHSGQIQGFFDGPVDHLTAMPVLVDWMASNLGEGNRQRLAGTGLSGARWNADMAKIDTPAVARLLREYAQRASLRGGNPYRSKAYLRRPIAISKSFSLMMDQRTIRQP